ncbi:head-tail connector protein [Psychromarinibacter halotolerans]|uniref:PhiE125 gp8 family phage protein n=1 Tax=Psychromarinibacter halotolerans TaxID=1775175 RepID=A0ABV7GYF7_9RHOB|nr:hypothetical protein [Psychromarinibacter halotolerans]MDF0598985.1 hypothetical protein [Psychromarinibacter halotolerans]
MSLTTITPPSQEPLTAADPVLRQHLRKFEDETHEDALIGELIAAARADVETYTRLRLLTQTVTWTRDGFCSIEIPVAPVQEVVEVRYLSSDGSWVTVASDVYRLTGRRVVAAPGKVWPVPACEPGNVEIDVKVGYGDAASDVRPEILHAVRRHVAHLLLHRGDQAADGGMTEAVRRTLRPFILWM